MQSSNEKIVMTVSKNTIIGNIALSGFKLIAGILASSGAMISDAVHSLSDVLTTFIVIAGFKMAGKKSDKEHPYGHERMECVAAIILAVILFAVGLMIGWNGVSKIFMTDQADLTVPGVLALVAAAVSVAVKEAMYWYTRAAAKKVGSGALMADAWHHRSDAFSSVGSFAGILGARLGLPVLDPVASVIICLFILKVAYDIFMDSIGKMTDKACDDKTVEEIRAVVLAQETVAGIDLINTRLFGDKIYVDVEISVHGGVSLVDAHQTAHNVHDAIEKSFERVKHCMVHVNPCPEQGETAAGE